MLRRILYVILSILTIAAAAPPVSAESALPAFRFAAFADTDAYGSDLDSLFDTDLSTCVKVCVNRENCAGFTFNARSNACFPKASIGEMSPYAGAFSAAKLPVPEAIRRFGADQAARLPFVAPAELAAAHDLARDIGLRHLPAGRSGQELLQAARERAARGEHNGAMRWMGRAVALGGSGALWTEYAALLLRAEGKSREKRAYRAEAYRAALNGFLRSRNAGAQVNALVAAARAAEQRGQGRQMLPLLRLAEDIQPRYETAEMLDKAIGKYGFRVSGSTVSSDSAAPRICVQFSEDLARSGVEYGDYLKLPDRRLVVTAEGRQLCIDGVAHGERYSFTLRRGLPAADGEVLYRDVEQSHYVRDRSPAVRFPGRAYVLPQSDQAALPVETVNLAAVDLRLRRISDRNLLRAVQDGFFGRPLSQWQDEQFSEQIAQEVWTGTAEVQNSLNQDMITRLPLAEALAGQPVGIYALSARIPGADPYDEPGATQWFVLSDLGLSSMLGADGLHVQVQGLSDAQPRGGVEVTLVSRANAVLARAATDATGYARFDAGLTRGLGAAAPAMLLARLGDQDFGFLSLTDPAFDLSDRGVEGREASGPVDVFVATDRGAYRAGETIHATVLTRDSRARAIEGLPLTAILSRPDGVEYSRHISQGGDQGGHVFALPVSAAAPRGTWQLELKSDPEAPALARRSILVEDFLPERIDFTQALESAEDLRPGGAAALRIDARYLFGAPGAGLSIDGEVRLSAAGTVAGWPGYRFGRYDARSTASTAHFGADPTGPDGTATASLTLPDSTTAGKPLQAQVITRLADGSARPVERRLEVPVRPATAVIGIKPLFDEEVAEGTEARFEVIGLGADLQPQAMELRWTLNRVETRYQWYQLYGNWNWEATTRRTRVATGTATVGGGSPLAIASAVDWGRYELVVERLDGAYTDAAVDFYAGWYAPADAAATPDKLEVSLNQPDFAPGDTARLRIVSRTAGTALVSVMSNRLIERRAVAVEAGETLVPLQVTEDWGSSAYVTAMVLRPTDGQAARTPARALGLAHAAIRQPGQQLQVTIDHPEVARPRASQTVTVTATGAAPGEEVWMTLAAVDLGILNLTGFASPDPSSHYFGQRRLGMELRDVYGRLIDGQSGALGRIRSGGDADQGMRMQSPPPTQDLMAVFSGPVQLDAEGRARVPVDLPAFNGTVRLMAVAWSGKAVGQAEADMLVRDPVVVTATAPRFLAPGDRSRVLLQIVHADGPSGAMQIEAEASSPGSNPGLSLGTLPQQVVLGDQGKAELELEVTAAQVSDPEILLRLTTPDGTELTQAIRLPVRANDPAVARTRRLSLAAGDSFLFSDDVFAAYQPGSARAVLSAGPLARFDVPGLLSSLDRYPYGCTEQVTSKALPLLYLSSVAEAAGLGSGPAVQARVQAAIDTVLTRQSGNGAFGLWRPDYGDLWLDAYVTDFLSRARRQGHDVPDQAFRQALDNLRNQVNYAPDFDSGGGALAYALLVLAREGAAAMADLRYYADVKGEAFDAPLAAAQLGGALAAYGDQIRADRMFAQAGAQLRTRIGDSRLWRADYGTRLRDRAAVLTLAAEARSTAVDQQALAQQVSQGGSLLSTQESVWTLLAAQALIDSPEASGLRVDGVAHAGAFVQMRDGQSGGAPVGISAADGRSTEITLTTLGVPKLAPPAGGTGYTIERLYYSMEGAPLDPAAGFRTGDRFVTVLRVTPDAKGGARLMINDPLPAGVEIDNPSLLRSGDLRDLAWLKPSTAEHAEFRSDRFLAAVDQHGTAPVVLAYVARAVSPGSFHHPAASVEDMYRPAFRARTATSRLLVR